MPFSLLRSFVLACGSAARPTRRHRRGVGPRSREASVGLESLEQRMALTVAAPSIRLAAASDTGLRNDGITRFARPVFTGTAPARSSVVVFADGQLIGSTRAGVTGAWSLATPTAKPLTTGAHIITAQAALNRQASTATPMWMAVDPTPPTASLAYDSLNGRATLTFSEPVSGVQLGNLFLSGRTPSGVTLASVPIKDSRAQFFVGVITMSQSPDRKTYTFQQQLALAESGNYTLSFVKTGVTDRAGNPLVAGALTRFTII